MGTYHTPVLRDKSLDYLVTSPSGTYIDATFGGGGHTIALLSRLSGDGRVIAFDRDADSLGNAPEDPRLYMVHGNFRYIRNFALLAGRREDGFPEDGKVDGILADLGVSSHQFDTASRGFSFRWDAPLDMRMNTEGGMTAADVVGTYGKEDLERILRLYGEVDSPGRVASLIVKAREEHRIETTGELSSVLEPVLPKAAPHKVLAKIFQALRIEVNQEMKALEKFLRNCTPTLAPGGTLVVITYHSLEDRMVKNFMKTGSVSGEEAKDFYGRSLSPFEVLTRKPVLPSEEEISSNTRARSAKLRAARRIQ